MEAAEEAILKTLAYADIFDYPLRAEEVWRYLITDHESKRIGEFDKALSKLIKEGRIGLKEGHCFLSGREEIVRLRKKREEWSGEKVKRAERIARLLKIIPTVKLVGISGALAMNNADEGDDIDLFVVTSAGRLWLTRFLVTVLVELTGQRRKPFPKYHIPHTTYHIQNMICLNMFVDVDHLAIPTKEQNLFTAHEVVQMRPIWDRNDTYQRFLAANKWVGRYLPNAVKNEKLKIKKEKLPYIVDLLEKIAFWAQVKYMERRKTTEKVSPGRILFHPEDKSRWVMGKYKRKLKMKN